MKTVLLILYILDSCLHLYASYQKDRKLRKKSKLFLIPLLAGWYYFAAEPVMLLFILALFFSWLGDVLLIPHGVKWFALGGISFGVSHLLFIFSYLPEVDFSAFKALWVPAAFAVYLTAVILIFRKLRPLLPKELFFPMLAYLCVNASMNCFALFRLLTLGSRAAAIGYAGALLFFCSDATLFFVRFRKDSAEQNHFPVMLTYLLGEFLIALGML